MGKFLVVGLGISGQAAATLLLSEGHSVLGVDQEKIVKTPSPALQTLQKQGLEIALETAPLAIKNFEAVVVSPGIPQTHPLYAAAAAAGVAITGEAELSFKRLKQPCVAITGTNGKTTVTLLVAHVLSACGIPAKALGNVGEPLATYVLEGKKDEVVVAELSSYQLETMETPVFDAGVILNITPDHLDRYGNMEAYAAAKCRLKRCLKKKAPLFVHADVAAEYGALLADVSYEMYGQGTDFWTDKCALWCGEKIESLLPLCYRDRGNHESENALAAWLLCRPFGITGEPFAKALETFKKPAHRIEYVATVDDVVYYDDSKGTNIDAVVHAVNAMQGSVILIAGGVDKGASYLPWVSSFRKGVKKIVAIGQAREKIFQELGFAFNVELADSLEKAVTLAAACAEKGDHVLLSPGCSSFDMFRDYKHRGEEFKRYVHHLEERRKQ